MGELQGDGGAPVLRPCRIRCGSPVPLARRAMSASADKAVSFERCQLIETAAVTHLERRGARGARALSQRGSRRKTKSRMTTKWTCLSAHARYVDSREWRSPHSHTETGPVDGGFARLRLRETTSPTAGAIYSRRNSPRRSARFVSCSRVAPTRPMRRFTSVSLSRSRESTQKRSRRFATLRRRARSMPRCTSS